MMGDGFFRPLVCAGFFAPAFFLAPLDDDFLAIGKLPS